MLQIFIPLTLIFVTIAVAILAAEAIVVLEFSFKLVTVEEFEMAFDLEIVLPIAVKDGTFCKEILALPVFPTFSKLSHVLVLVAVLQVADAVGHIVTKLADVNAPIAINNLSFALAQTIHELSLIYIPVHVDKHTLTVFDSGVPLPFVLLLLFWDLVNSITLFEVVVPIARVVGAINVVVRAHSLLQPVF